MKIQTWRTGWPAATERMAGQPIGSRSRPASRAQKQTAWAAAEINMATAGMDPKNKARVGRGRLPLREGEAICRNDVIIIFTMMVMSDTLVKQFACVAFIHATVTSGFTAFVTFGKKHVTLARFANPRAQLSSRPLSFFPQF